jgi:hypothetical protein
VCAALLTTAAAAAAAAVARVCRAFGIFIVGIGIVTSSILFSTIYLLGGFPANTVPIKA